MSKHTGDAGRVGDPLARVLDTPHLARVVPDLAPETLHQLVRHYGLDACGELVALATPRQLASLFDLDLWRRDQPGRDERFDADRFGEWLELLIETDTALAARTVAAMDEKLVIAGLAQHVRVFDVAAIAAVETDDDSPGPEPTPSGHECEVGGYLVRALRRPAWDAIVALLIALDADHPESFHALMRGCRRLSNSTPEVDGLDDLLTVPQQLMHDVALDRDRRRSQHGYSTAADARAFLQLARQQGRRSDRTSGTSPISAAYFRAADNATTLAALEDAGTPDLTAARFPNADVPEAVDAVVQMFAEVLHRPRALLEGPDPRQSPLTVIRTLMEYVRDNDDTAYLRRGLELAFLSNTLAAGCSLQGRSFTPQEASDAAIGICNLGLEHSLAEALPPAFLMDHDLVTAFEAGWAVLHQQVSMFAAQQLLAVVRDLRSLDPDIRSGLRTLRNELKRHWGAGTPWHASKALEVLALLDMPVWMSLLGLMNECPVMPAALSATLEGRASAVSATAFEFISTTSQIDAIQRFMARLPDLLRG